MRSLWFLFAGGCLPATTGPSPERTCDDVVADFEAERTSLTSCGDASECGQALTGTSCGCTRDLVARLDADATAFYALIDEGTALGCGLGLTSVCDCPEAAGFLCDSGTCTWNYVDQYVYLPRCATSEGDPVTVDSVHLQGSELLVRVSYSGGCEAHDVTLCWPDQAFAESYPVQASLELYHDDHDDPCDAVISEERQFSLAPLADAYRDAYGATAGTVTVHLGGHTVAYTF